jgi:hypothetical protein
MFVWYRFKEYILKGSAKLAEQVLAEVSPLCRCCCRFAACVLCLRGDLARGMWAFQRSENAVRVFRSDGMHVFVPCIPSSDPRPGAGLHEAEQHQAEPRQSITPHNTIPGVQPEEVGDTAVLRSAERVNLSVKGADFVSQPLWRQEMQCGVLDSMRFSALLLRSCKKRL